MHVEPPYFGKEVHCLFDIYTYFTKTTVQFFCAGGFRSVDDSCEVISCNGYASYYYYISKCDGVRWVVEPEIVSVVGAYAVGWGVEVRWTMCLDSYWKDDVTPDRGSPGHFGYRCSLFPTPTAV